jgi:hypothetical protein
MPAATWHHAHTRRLHARSIPRTDRGDAFAETTKEVGTQCQADILLEFGLRQAGD